MSHTSFSPISFDYIAVERAISESRTGRPVLITSSEMLEASQALLIIGIEAFSHDAIDFFKKAGALKTTLLLPAARLRVLGLERNQPGAVALPYLDIKRIENLAVAIGAKIDAPVCLLSREEDAAMELGRLSLTAPVLIAGIVTLNNPALEFIYKVDAGHVLNYRAEAVQRLSLVSRAPVPLEMAEAEFAVFRGGEGLRDQVAIIVGKPDFSKPVPVRLHSACLTGDLFGSLKCDCGDQLRGAVRWMADNGGGILLYLDQEGRGNGIANKIRAYELQSKGWDTYDADEALGFNPDQRRFDFAARMLILLGVSQVHLMTNNPVKIEALQKAGLEVVSQQRVLGRPTRHNLSYLTSKRDRAGHFIDVDAMVARAPFSD